MKNPEFERQFAHYLALFDRQSFKKKPHDQDGFNDHIRFLRQLAAVENSSVAVMDLRAKQYIFLQSKFLPAIGLELDDVLSRGPRALFEIMHPKDVPGVIDTLTQGIGFLLDLPLEEKKDHKLIYDFHLQAKEGTYLRFIQQLVPLEIDADGNILLMLLLNDLVPDRREGHPAQRKMVNIRTGALSLFKGEEGNSRTILSKREIEVLGLLSKGKRSKEVADELFLSVNTVNNHRRKILEKTNTENTAEAIRYAISLGLM